ncbi:MAG: hypothetical protein N3A61_06005, partial [Ignavibacteria bacterium]|nr:hypothetical protein [Ignavibacteria bacterium]
MSFKRIILLQFLLTFQLVVAQEAEGIFLNPTIGSRFPIYDASDKHKVGFSLGAKLEYANTALPFFITTEIQYTNFPQNKYVDNAYHQKSIIGGAIGIEYLFYPFFTSEVIFIPSISFDLRLNYIKRAFTTYSPRIQTMEPEIIYRTSEDYKFGFGLGAGLSIFLIDINLKYY